MAIPAERSPALETVLDDMSLAINGVKRTAAIREDMCVVCHKPADKFKDDISRREYTISGMCQACQDELPGGE